MKSIEITKNNIKEIIQKDGIVLLDFWASWCGPCKMFAPVFEKVAQNHPDIVFGKINTDNERELAGEFDISSIPTIVAFRDGVMLMNQPGMLPERELESLISHIKGLNMDEVKNDIESK